MVNASYKQELADLQVSERKLKNGKSLFYVTTKSGVVTSALHDTKDKAERAMRRVASHVTYKKNILKYKKIK
jgi:hypothetical protein